MATIKLLRANNVMLTLRVDKLPKGMSVTAFVKYCVDKLKPDFYAYIIHKNDKSKNGGMAAPHVHIVFHFRNSRYITSLSKQIEVDPQFFVKWNGDVNVALAYLTHNTKSSRNRYAYRPEDVVASFDYVAFLEEYLSKSKGNKIENSIKIKLDLLLTGEMTVDQVLSSLTAFEQSKYKKAITDTYNRKLELDTKNWIARKKAENRPTDVIWIYGNPATGKSSLAYEIASRNGDDEIYIAGSSRDPFENYKSNCHVVILDDLRYNCGLTYADLLHIFDPYAVGGKEVYASSRYTDKALALDLIIITCPQSPSEFYREMFHISEFAQNHLDPFDQLRRRLSLVMYLSEYGIFRAEYNGRDYEPDPTSIVANKYSHFARNNNTLDWDSGKTLFKKLFIDDVKPKTSKIPDPIIKPDEEV